MVVSSMSQASNSHRQLLPRIPVIDLSLDRSLTSQLIVKACEGLGFFKVINHGVLPIVATQMEAAGEEFFAMTAAEKQQAGPANPLGYGCRTIGFNGDIGNVEYLLLPADPTNISQRASSICKKDPSRFSSVMKDYVEAMKELATQILKLIEEGLGLGGSGVLHKLIWDSNNDSLLRLNHYPSRCSNNEYVKGTWSKRKRRESCRIGFGEHTDPQILTLLRSNGTGGLQILAPGSRIIQSRRVWISIQPDPTAVFINVGDVLQAMTNGRLVSVRHRAMINSQKSRMSMVYFVSPDPHAWITPLPGMITTDNPQRYKFFTWAEYKEAMYSLKLGQNRLDHFKIEKKENNA